MRYFFHVRHHDVLLEDPEGIDFASIDMVRREAIEGARCMIAERIKLGRPLEIDTAFEVRDEGGGIVLVLPFASVLLASLAPRQGMTADAELRRTRSG